MPQTGPQLFSEAKREDARPAGYKVSPLENDNVSVRFAKTRFLTLQQRTINWFLKIAINTNLSSRLFYDFSSIPVYQTPMFQQRKEKSRHASIYQLPRPGSCSCEEPSIFLKRTAKNPTLLPAPVLNSQHIAPVLRSRKSKNFNG